MSKPRKHHIIPQMLLKHFTYKNKICLYSKKSESYHFNQDIKNVCVQKNFYGNDSVLEKFLANEIESAFAESLENFKKIQN
jgi:hypothetical protein